MVKMIKNGADYLTVTLVVSLDIVPEQAIELFQRMNL